ncbi:beta-ketoacyl-ACP synthase II [Treponema zuelzerae]|uniref:3-oxoacyl-[acyl-carrier-protein] synthase 2 n=1 Tax=Teretinema zuelzerae TaxID=156 RepID=A0AAE3EL01_9SPIR|nr:beta-ketoacyl-ACP synthase II [Teretinema zuelzerae]MCD1655653.1 beta-ketoacyl-ACP synthase II [Teretinema zuelzerae]
MKRRVVVTGLGAVTPIGNTVDEMWASIREGKCGVGPITQFDASEYAVKIAAEVKNFDPTLWIDRKEARKMARFCQFMTVAAAQAIKDAGFDKETISAAKSGVMVGNGIGGFEVIEASMKKYFEAGPSRVPPLSIPMLISNEGAGNISMLYGIKGVSWTLATACASSTDSLGAALDLVRSGRLDVCVAGGSEAAITGFGIGGFSVLQTLASSFNDNPGKASRPFDRDREGFIMGEGAGILILEELEHALARGAKIYAEFAGYGGSSDAYHITSPNPDGSGGALAITRALEDAGIRPEDVQYYNAHGTSTPVNDPAETLMIKRAFGDHAYKMKVSSTKSMTGHCVGAAGAIEAIIGIKSIVDGFYPPTINLDNPDVEHGCDLDYVPNKGVEGSIDCIASGSLGFGGHNGVVVMRKFKK